MTEGMAWNSDGNLHAHALLMVKLPAVGQCWHWPAPSELLTESNPRSNNRPKIPRGIIDSGKHSPMLRMRKLSNQQRRRALRNSTPKPDEEAGGNEHGDIDTNGLKNDTEDHQQAASHNANSSTCVIGYVRRNDQRDDPTDGHDRIEKTTGGGTRVIER